MSPEKTDEPGRTWQSMNKRGRGKMNMDKLGTSLEKHSRGLDALDVESRSLDKCG